MSLYLRVHTVKLLHVVVLLYVSSDWRVTTVKLLNVALLPDVSLDWSVGIVYPFMVALLRKSIIVNDV
jgi:hypothetical protein